MAIFNFGFFGNQEHRVFNYKPRYYDPEEEERRRMFGDVAIHAVCDALLGALALGDIGHLFPDTSDEWKGVDSKLLLGKVVALVKERGFRVGNVDVTIALQRPKLAPHIVPMRETLAPILGVSVDAVSVKATTTERLGFVGRGEGCEVWASAIVIKD